MMRPNCGSTCLHATWAQTREFLLHAVGDTGVHGRSSGEHNIAVQVTTNIKIAFEDRVVAVSLQVG